MRKLILIAFLFVAFAAGAQTFVPTGSCKAVFTYSVNPLIDTLAPATSINFLDMSDGNIVSWNWDFGDGVFDYLHSNAIHTFLLPGTYYSKVFVNTGDPDSCSAFDFAQIIVMEEPTIDIPGFFTPNADGYNDYFYVKSTGMINLNVKIYDQWGGRIYEITDTDGKWDGLTNGGKDAPEGTYYYYLEATAQDNKTYYREGSVFLIRDDVEIYPNPAGEFLNINLNNRFSGEISYDILTAYGVKIQSESLNAIENIKIYISGLSRGFYILRVYNDEQQVYTSFIKR